MSTRVRLPLDARTRRNQRRSLMVFLGDSQTAGTLTFGVNFPAQAQQLCGRRFTVVNKGIGGQNTTQMLARVQADVVALAPQVVVFQGSTNDLSQSVSFATSKANIAAIAAAVVACGAEFVICTIPPRNQQTVGLGASEVRDYNTWIKVWAAANGFRCIDNNAELVDPRTGQYSTGLNDDSIHPNAAGIFKMAHRAAATLMRDTPAVEAASLVPVEYNVDVVTSMPATVSYSAQLVRNPLLYPTTFGDSLNYPNDPDWWYSDSHASVAGASAGGDTTVQVSSKLTPGTYRFSTGQVQQETRTITSVTGSSAPYTATVSAAFSNPHPVSHTIDRADSVSTLLAPAADDRFAVAYARKVVASNQSAAWSESIDLWPSSSGTWAVGDKLRIVGKYACDTPVGIASGKGFDVSLVFTGASGEINRVRPVTAWAYQTPMSLAPSFAADATVPAGTTSIKVVVTVDAGTGSGTFLFSQLGVYNFTTLGLDTIALAA